MKSAAHPRTPRDLCIYLLKIISFGQLICITFTLSGLCRQELDIHHLGTPFLNALLTYLTMFSFMPSRCSQEPPEKKTPKWKFLICAIFDMIGLITALYAYQYTRLASIDLMSVFGITMATILSIIFLKLRYSWLHYLGLALSLVGIVVTVWSDLYDKNGNLDFGSFWGDILAIFSSISYAVSNVIQQKLLSEGTPLFTYLSHIGMFDSVLVLIFFLGFTQFFTLAHFDQSPFFLLYYPAYTFNAVVNYILIGIFVEHVGATPYNIISLSTVLWSMLADVFIFSKPFKIWCLVGFALIIAGVVLFHIRKPRKVKSETATPAPSIISEVTRFKSEGGRTYEILK